MHWTFNHSGSLQDVAHKALQGAAAGAGGAGTSGTLLYYTPATEQDYGTLACSGSNAVGRQAKPCVFQVSAAVRPSSPANCSLSNMTAAGFLRIECSEGYDGGLPQWFQLQMVEVPSMLVR